MSSFSETHLLQTILAEYRLPLDGAHGVAHWARVLENGLRLAEESGASIAVVRLFAIFHDSRRVSEGLDPDHGPRAAVFAQRLRGRLFDLSDREFALLVAACQGHTRQRTHHNPTVQTCFDADRLDLGRVKMTPDPRFLSTAIAKRPETIAWAHGRSSMGVVPELVRQDWGLDLEPLP